MSFESFIFYIVETHRLLVIPTMENEDFLQLGNFANLPPEIRLEIWEYLFSTCDFRGRPVNRERGQANNLSILRSSRQLYHEISRHLYKDLIHTVHLSPMYYEGLMGIDISSKWLSLRRRLENMADAERHFWSFPLHGVFLAVNIVAPDSDDPGQVVLLWQRANALVDLLNSAPGSSPACLFLQAPLKGHWLSEEKPTQSIEYAEGHHTDNEIIVSAFFRLRSRCDIHPSSDLSDLRMDQSKSSRKALLSHFGSNQAHGEERSYISNMNKRLIDIAKCPTYIAMLLDNALDTIPGKTAKLLRRDRFSKWFEDGDSWKSPYEEELLSNYTANLASVGKYDIWLSNAFRRHGWLIIYHHRACLVAEGNLDHMWTTSRTPPGQHQLFETWDSKIWEIIYPGGIPELEPSEILRWPVHASMYRSYRNTFKQIARFPEAVNWCRDYRRYALDRTAKVFYCLFCSIQQSPCRWCKIYNPDFVASHWQSKPQSVLK